MKRLAIAAGVLVVLAVAVFAAMHFFAAPPKDLDLVRSKVSDNGLYAIEIAPESGEATRGPLHNWVVTVQTPDGKAVEGATIGVDGGMPQHGHGLPTSPAVTAYLGDGRYRIEGMRFNMSGWWVLELAIDGPAGADKAVFNLVL